MNVLYTKEGTSRRKLAAVLLGLLTACVSVDAGAATLAEMSPEERNLLVNEMNASAKEVGSKGLFYYDDPLPVSVSVSLDVENSYVIVNLDEKLGPRAETAETEDLLDAIRFSILNRYDRVEGMMGIRVLYGGKPSTYWFPEPSRDEPPDDRLVEPTQGARPPIVAISPGHGLYYHHGFKDWRPHRETINGVLEDDITPVMATQLASALQSDGVTVHNFRPEQNVLTHSASGQPWWRLGVRYQLEEKLPSHPEIWHAFATSKHALRERNEDLRSRPLYANFLAVDAFLHVHTNAHTPDARGARAIIHERAPDRLLATNILCSMRELIHAKEEFGSYPVSSQPASFPDKGENKHANMPSVIVEVGFHTNPEDALLLRNREFQGLAMRGVAKGYRLFREGKPCEDFAVKPVAEALGRVGYDVHLPLALAGNPAFPVRVTSRTLNCSGRYCPSRSVSLYNPAEVEKHRVQYLCTRDNLGKPVVELSIDARDYDGVAAKPATYRVACGR
jgi:N-acetylmuramoyl-L-alanine amidase